MATGGSKPPIEIVTALVLWKCRQCGKRITANNTVVKIDGNSYCVPCAFERVKGA